MRALLVTWGSRGDFQPFIALGRALTEAGHEVTLAGPPYAADAVAQRKLAFAPVGPVLDPSIVGKGVDRMVAASNPLLSASILMRDYLAPSIEPTFRDLLPLAAKADLVVSHHIQPAGMRVAEVAGIPAATVALTPHSIRTALRAPGTPRSFGRPVNKLLWRVAAVVLDRVAERPVNDALRRAGLAEAPGFFFEGGYSRDLNLVAVSPVVSPRPGDWPRQHLMTGYWHLDEGGAYESPPELADFLAAGDPPVVVTFGSMGTERPAELTEIVIDGLNRSRRRGLLQSGWAGLGAADDDRPLGESGPARRRTSSNVAELSGHLTLVDDVPHDWLFPRTAVIVHHGGAGTGAAALRAGVPQVVVAHMADQFAWGDELHRLGVAAKPLRRKGLSAASLAEAIVAASSAERRSRAEDVARAMASERPGVEVAVEALERLVEGRSNS